MVKSSHRAVWPAFVRGGRVWAGFGGWVWLGLGDSRHAAKERILSGLLHPTTLFRSPSLELVLAALLQGARVWLVSHFPKPGWWPESGSPWVLDRKGHESWNHACPTWLPFSTQIVYCC